jgi:UDP-glucose 4-epimerase
VRCLVTGGSGFIGSNLVDALVARGDEVTVVDDLSTGRRENLDRALEDGAELVEADVRDGEAMIEVAKERRAEMVFHLAAQIDVRRSIVDPSFDAGVNVGGTANLLEAARVAGSRRFVFVSTGGAIYGEGEGKQLPLPEDAAEEPLAPYGQSKLAAEGYVSLYRRLYGLSGVILRLGNVYGPRQDPLGEAGVIAIFCGRLIASQAPTVYGDGTQTRDYVYVADVVAANLAAAAHPEAHGSYNVGTGNEASVLEVIAALRTAAGLGEDEFQPEFAPPRTGELQRSWLDVTRARAELGFTADTDLVAGMGRTASRWRSAPRCAPPPRRRRRAARRYPRSPRGRGGDRSRARARCGPCGPRATR